MGLRTMLGLKSAASKKNGGEQRRINKTAMRAYWDQIGRREDAETQIAHQPTREGFLKSGFENLTQIFPCETKSILPGSTVVEIGCGKGRIVRALAQRRPDLRIMGVDVSDRMIEMACNECSQWPNTSFCVTNGMSLASLGSNTADVIYSFIVFQHVPRPAVIATVADSARVLKPGGRLIFQVQQQDEVQAADPPDSDFRSIRYYTKDQAIALIAPPLKLLLTRGGGHNFFVEAERA